MDGIRGWIEAEGSGHWFFMAFPVALICLLIWFKGRRVRFLIPSLIISIVIINPVFFKYWDELGLYAYWRIIWVVPVIPIAASLVPSISEKIRKTSVKGIIAVAGVGLIVLGGTFLYNGAGGSFVEAANAAKLPEEVVAVADRLLELDEHPRIIAEPNISTYVRQYTGQIDCLYGRNIYGYISSPTSSAVWASVDLSNTESDLSTTSQIMLDDGYGFLIMGSSERSMEGFRLIDSVGEYGIWSPIGKPSLMKRWDDLGRVVSVTRVDDNGNPFNGTDGYATVQYDYDEFNNIVYEFRTNADGTAALDEYDSAGFEREYDANGHIVRETKLGSNGQPCMGLLGFAEVRRIYRNGVLLSESHYDDRGNPTMQVAGFASYDTQCDKAGEQTKRTYYDVEGNIVNRIDGYAWAEWQIDENGKTKNVKFYDLDGQEVCLDGLNLAQNIAFDPDGWSSWMMPNTNAPNDGFNIGLMNLGKKQEGDLYTCQVEIEFRDVQTTGGFHFQTQGRADGKWIGNVWYPNVVNLDYPPTDGIYMFSSTVPINDVMANASTFGIGFRCDGWTSGSFRVKNVKIEKGSDATDWTPGL